MKMLGVCGSPNTDSRTRLLVERVLDGAAHHGAETEFLDLAETEMPVFRADDAVLAASAPIAALRARTEAADVLMLASPVYHGTISGALKNFLDFHTGELAGKLVGLGVTTSRGLATGCLQHLGAVIQSFRAWTLPYDVAASKADFDGEGTRLVPRVDARLQAMARDLVVYGALLRERHRADRARAQREGADAGELGFAAWHG